MDEIYLSNVALMSTFYEEKKNYFDVYFPFIVKSLSGQELCNLEQILDNLREIFQFGLPISVVKTIIQEHEGKAFQSQRRTGNWEISLTERGKEIFAKIAQDERDTEADLASFYRSLRAYLASAGVPVPAEADLASKVRAFLQRNLSRFTYRGFTRKESEATGFDTIFVRYLFEVAFKDRSVERLIERMWKGMVLLNSMSTNKQTKRVDTFTRPLDLYVDTNVVFSLLGLHNPVLNRATQELFQLIEHTARVKVYVYDETIREFDRILDVFEGLQGNFYEIQVDSVFYFLKSRGYNRSTLLELKEDIETALGKRGITLRPCSEIDGQISEYYIKLFGELLAFRKARNEKLPEDMRRTNAQLERSAHHDAKVLSNVLISKNKRTRNIQDVGALFLTASNNLYNDYLTLFHRFENYPCVIRDIALTNWLYIMNPTSDNGPQLESILGLHSSSLFIESRIWQRYVSALKQMLSRDMISTKQFALLVSNNKAVVEFLQNTRDDAVTEVAIRGVLQDLLEEGEARDKAFAEALSKAEESGANAAKLASELDALRRDLEKERRRTAALSRAASDRFVDGKLRRYARGQVISFGLYVVFLLTAGLVYYLQQNSKLFLLGLAVFFIPFVRSLVRHDKLLEMIKYVFSRKKREERKAALRTLYEQEYFRQTEKQGVGSHR